MKLSVFLSIVFIMLPLVSSCGEDRSGEQPFAPEVQTVGYEVDADSVFLAGKVLSSPNSTLLQCGFAYGNDTLRLQTEAAVPAEEFRAATRPLLPGTYFAVAFARNGVGTSYGDTLYFTIEK